MAKTLEQNFADWESHVFGYGYGTGEEHTISALSKFLSLCNRGEALGYHYVELETELGATVAWLLINILAHHRMIEYGTSPRGGWLTENGLALKEFMLRHTPEVLIEMTGQCGDYIYCCPDYCNCGPSGYEPGRKCANPFWDTPAWMEKNDGR